MSTKPGVKVRRAVGFEVQAVLPKLGLPSAELNVPQDDVPAHQDLPAAGRWPTTPG